jgi:hypothetical protein
MAVAVPITADQAGVIADDPRYGADGYLLTASYYFLPPVEAHYPPRQRLERMGIRSRAYQNLLWTWKGTDSDGLGGTTIAGISYRGGYWTGPLSAQQVADIQAAGYGSRIAVVNGPGDLPAGLD